MQAKVCRTSLCTARQFHEARELTVRLPSPHYLDLERAAVFGALRSSGLGRLAMAAFGQFAVGSGASFHRVPLAEGIVDGQRLAPEEPASVRLTKRYDATPASLDHPAATPYHWARLQSQGRACWAGRTGERV
jgi:hypothetical protein